MERRFLLLYGTTDGHTRKVAGAIADELRSFGDTVDVVNAERIRPPVLPGDYAAVIVAGSVHVGGYQRSVRRWVRAHREALADRPTAFVSVCLGVLEHNPHTDRELDRILTRFFDKTGWHPTMTKVVAGALLFTKYGWLKRHAILAIVRKQLSSNVDTTRDYEYTDWNDVRAFAREFRQQVAPDADAEAGRVAVLRRRGPFSDGRHDFSVRAQDFPRRVAHIDERGNHGD